MNKQLKLYTAFHKPFYQPTLDFVVPVWAGKRGRDTGWDMQGDDTGDNISNLNDYFSELTVLYWVWKNAGMNPDDVWGFCHYRRYFSAPFKGLFDRKKEKLTRKPEKKYIDKFVEPKLKTAILDRMKNAEVIIPHLVNASLRRKIIQTIEEKYVTSHPAEDWQILKSVLLEKYPEYEKSFDSFSKQTKMAIANMMIAKTSTWDKYLTWLFDILFEVFKRLPQRDDTYQRRSVGFMAERLMNLYIQHNQLRTDYLQIVIFDKK